MKYALRAVGAGMLLVLAGCGGRATISQADGFADAGVAYADSVPAFYDESFMLAATADSLVLAMNRDPLTPEERAQGLADSDTLLAERLLLLRDLKAHALTLRAYFIALKALATTDAAGDISDATEGLVARLGALSPKIAGASIGGTPVSTFIEPAVSLAVAAYQSAALRHEIAARGPAIERELALQKAAIDAIGEQMLADWELEVQIEERNPLYEQFIADGSLPRDWSDRRIAALRRTADLDALNAASKAIDSLHRAWIAFAEGRLGEPGLLLLIRDVEELARLAATLRGDG